VKAFCFNCQGEAQIAQGLYCRNCWQLLFETREYYCGDCRRAYRGNVKTGVTPEMTIKDCPFCGAPKLPVVRRVAEPKNEQKAKA